MDLDNRLCKLESDVSHYMFIDNCVKFMSNNYVRQELYETHDNAKGHINNRRTEILTQNSNGPRQAHFKQKLQQRYDVVPATFNV